jgi:acetyl-CoA C-acetyltransferase
MTTDPRTPVIVGAGQVVHRNPPDAESTEPVTLMVEALRLAGEDSGTGDKLLRRADSVRCVPVIAWRYLDAAALVADELGARPRETVQSAAIGGDGPQRLLNDTARAIGDNEIDVALVGGGEAVASMGGGAVPRWRHQADDVKPSRELDEYREPVNETELAAGVAFPVIMYALVESAVRAASGDVGETHLDKIAGLWSRFSHVAADNPFAWIQRTYRPEEIATPSTANRLVAAPYTKLLTANMQVNMGSGLVVCSAQAAEDAGVPKDRWVFIHAGAQAVDEWHVTERASLIASPAIRAVAQASLQHAGLSIDDIAHVDLYSCFPSAVQVAAGELGLAIEDDSRPLTVTGGLTFAGGPGNNYTSHAIATLVHRLREDPDVYGLATALGWYLTKHAMGIYSARPPQKPFASLNPQPEQQPARRSLSQYAGPATIEAYTITYARTGAPDALIISALTPGGERTLIRTDDRGLLDAVSTDDPIGQRIVIDSDRSLPNVLNLSGV